VAFGTEARFASAHAGPLFTPGHRHRFCGRLRRYDPSTHATCRSRTALIDMKQDGMDANMMSAIPSRAHGMPVRPADYFGEQQCRNCKPQAPTLRAIVGRLGQYFCRYSELHDLGSDLEELPRLEDNGTCHCSPFQS